MCVCNYGLFLYTCYKIYTHFLPKVVRPNYLNTENDDANPTKTNQSKAHLTHPVTNNILN